MCTRWVLGICEEATKNFGQCPAKRGFTHPTSSEVPEKFAEKLSASLGLGVEKSVQYAEQHQGI